MPQCSWQPYGGQQIWKSPQSVVVVVHCPFSHLETLQPVGKAMFWVVVAPWQSLSLTHVEQPKVVQYWYFPHVLTWLQVFCTQESVVQARPSSQSASLMQPTQPSTGSHF